MVFTSCQVITAKSKNIYTNLEKDNSWGTLPLCLRFLCADAFGTEEGSQRKHMLVPSS